MRWAFFCVLLLPFVAEAQTCGKRVDIVKGLNEKFGEIRHAAGKTDAGNLVEIFVSERGTWTEVVTTPKGVACLQGAGTDWVEYTDTEEASK